MLPVNLYRFYIYLRDHFLRTFVSRAIISVLKELIHLTHRLQRKERRMLFLDYQDRRPIYEQIVEKFRMLILSGAVEPSSKMPSVRQLAVELSINPNTIQRAYNELEGEGYIYSVPGNTIQRAYMELEQQGLICPVKGKGSFVTDSSRIRQIGMEETLSELKKITEKGMALGVGEEEMIGVICSCYKEGNND